MITSKDLENHLNHLKDLKDKIHKVESLYSNQNFIDIILEDFCGAQCISNIRRSVDVSLSDSQRDLALSDAQTAGNLLNYLSNLIDQADSVEQEILDTEQELDLTRAAEI